MLRYSTKQPLQAIYRVFLIIFIFLVASCNGFTTPTIDQVPSEIPTNISEGQGVDLLVSAPSLLPGQHLRFNRISLEQGLSQSTVFCILQDSQGFLWFGTEDGLNKYDGYNFTIYKHDPEDPNSIGGNWINALIEDDSGVLWIGTREGGLDRYDRNLNQFTHFRSDSEDTSSLSDNEVTAIYQDRDGVLWIGTGSGGLNGLVPATSSGQALSEAEGSDLENEHFIHYQHNPDDPNSLSSNAVSAIFEDQNGVLWIGTEDGGLNRLDSENESWWHYRNVPNNPHSLSHNNITAIYEDQSGALWVGTNGGGLNRLVPSTSSDQALSEAEESDQENEHFIHYQNDTDDPRSLSNDNISTIYQDREGVLWIGTWGGGLNIFDPEKENFTHYRNVPGDPHSLSSDISVSIYQDREGVLWFGTIAAGVNKLGVGRWNFAHYKNDPNNPNSLGDNMVRAFYQDREGVLWIGTMFGGVDRFDRETGNWRHYRHDPDDPSSLSNNFVSVIYADRSDVLWIGTASGLDKFEPQTETFTHYQAIPDDPPGSPSNNVRTIYENQAGEFWIGTKGGLYRFEPEKEIWSHHYRHDPGDPQSLSNDWVLSFFEDSEGIIWIGTFGGGLNRFDPEIEIFTRYQNVPDDPSSLSHNLVVGIIQDQDGTLWLGTGGGLNKFDPRAETFIHFREKDGMPNETMYCLVEDRQGHIWLSTNKGLSRFDPRKETFRNYDVTDGLQSNEFNSPACHKGDSEEMFFGGINGFNTFFPDQVRDNPTIPPVVLTFLTHGGEEVNCNSTVGCVTDFTLNWPDNAFEFEFAALSYAQPKKNQYAYMLDGFDEDWNAIGTLRYGKYTNLPGGTYILRLRGSNNDGIWNEEDAALVVTIVPPYWSTWWFRGGMLLALGGIAIVGYRLRVRSLEARSRELESEVEQRTAELMKIEEALRQSEMEEAVAAERSRLARDLHDSVTQTIFSMTLTTEATRQLLERDPSRLPSQLDKLQELSKHALAQMRSLIFKMRPTTVSEIGLAPALHHHIRRIQKQSGLSVSLDVVGESDLTGDRAERLYRIIQEALNNVVKHARVNKASITLRFEDEHTTITIEDQGQGFDPINIDTSQEQMGISSMRERVDMLNGTLTIESQPGKGTCVKVLIPSTKNRGAENG